MSTTRYSAEWTSIDGFEYRIDIIDTEYSSTTGSLEIGMDSFDGFTLDYSGENSGRYTPILASECIINCVVEDAAFESFINDIVNAQEQRFFVAIYLKDTTYKLFWAGLILQDLIHYEDVAIPYNFQIHASDGLARLRDIEYPSTLDTSETFIEYIINILNETNITQFWATGDLFLCAAIDWYEDSQFTTTPASSLDPLARSRVSNNAFMKLDEYDNIETLSCYEVLFHICNLWHASIIQTNGFFYIIQINNIYNGSFYGRKYTKAGAAAYTTSENFEVANTYFHRQGGYSFLPSLLSASVEYNYKQSLNANNLLIPQTNYGTAVSLGEIQGGSNETLIFNGTVRCTLDVGTHTLTDIHSWVFDMRIQVGTRYFTNKNGYTEWTTNSNDRYEVQSPFWHLPGFTGIYVRTFNIAIETLPIPNSDVGTFEFDYIKIIEAGGTTITLPTGSTDIYLCYDFQMQQNIDGEFESGKIEFSATNEDSSSNPVTSSSKIKFPLALMGDGPHDYSDGRIQVYTTGSKWENSQEEWTVGGQTSGGVDINTLLCKEAIAAQKQPIRVYMGTIEGNGMVILPINVLLIGSLKYILRSGKFVANTNTWYGDWVQIFVSRPNTATNYHKQAQRNNGIYLPISIQTQIENRAPITNPVFTGEITLGTTAVTETEIGILEGATVTTAELNYIDGVTGDLQDQIDDKAPSAHPVFTGEITLGSTEVSETEFGILAGATVTTAELNYIDGVTGDLQDQIDDKSFSHNPTFTGEIGIGSVNVSETELGILEGATVTTTELNYLDGVTSSIQDQIDNKADV